MAEASLILDGAPSGRTGFATTRWSLILRAGGEASPETIHALGELCQIYWPSLYAFLRISGYSRQDSEDLVQGFFVHLLEKRFVRKAHPEAGRFRSFLLGALKRFVSNEREKAFAQKRGGGQVLLSLDTEDEEERLRTEPADVLNPETIYVRSWVMKMVQRAVDQLKAQYRADGRESLLDLLLPHILGENAQAYSRIAAQLGVTEGAAKAAAQRMKNTLLELVRKEISQTVERVSEIEEEARYLLSVMRQ
jgi:RNA polymerase sigma factor (sigma-70 family)